MIGEAGQGQAIVGERALSFGPLGSRNPSLKSRTPSLGSTTPSLGSTTPSLGSTTPSLQFASHQTDHQVSFALQLRFP